MFGLIYYYYYYPRYYVDVISAFSIHALAHETRKPKAVVSVCAPYYFWSTAAAKVSERAAIKTSITFACSAGEILPSPASTSINPINFCSASWACGDPLSRAFENITFASS